jgi:hypothetical protein
MGEVLIFFLHLEGKVSGTGSGSIVIHASNAGSTPVQDIGWFAFGEQLNLSNRLIPIIVKKLSKNSTF